MTQVHKIILLIVDHDDLGIDSIKTVIENNHYPNHCITPNVMDAETKEVEWTDAHPLNNLTNRPRAFKQLFKE